jgi:uncharacterized protein YdeI (YjbR/CyaY-like superfamily)
MAHADAEYVRVATRAEWREWLAGNHASSPGVWVVTYKKASGKPAPSYDDLVEESLCFGWVDSRPGKVDDERTRLYICPRKKGSGWAATNKARIERLIADGQMMPAGLAVLEQAKADGSWTLLDASEAAIVADDLAAAFASYPGSREKWESFPLGVRKQILQWIDLSKRPETRAKRIDETARLAQEGVRANQYVPKDRR